MDVYIRCDSRHSRVGQRMDWHFRGDVSAIELAGIGYVVIFATFIAYICTMIGQKNLRPTLVGMYNYVQPIVASVIGVCLGLDRFTPVKIVAVALIFSRSLSRHHQPRGCS